MAAEHLPLTPELGIYLREISLRESPTLTALRRYTADLTGAQMQITPEQGQFMALLVTLIGARRIFELGTFTGYSALVMAQALPEDGQLMTCDTNPHMQSIAERFWQEGGVAHKIQFLLGKGSETLAKFLANGEAGTFDLVFIDADKASYIDYYQQSLKLVRSGGLILIDNVFYGGDVINPEARDKQTLTIRELNAMISRDQTVTVSVLPIGDGLTIVRKN